MKVLNFIREPVEEKFDLENSKTGSFTGIQRFGSSLALDIPFHTVFTEGAFVENTEGKAMFHNAPRPTDDDVASLLLKSLAEKTIVLLRRLGFLKEALEDGVDVEHTDANEHLDEHKLIKLGTFRRLIPIPYTHLVRYNGVFAPASPLKNRVIKDAPKERAEASLSSRIKWPELLKRTFGIDVTQCSRSGKLRLIA